MFRRMLDRVQCFLWVCGLITIGGNKYYPVGGGQTDIEYATVDTALEALVLHTLPDFGEHGDGIINNNFLFSMFKALDKSKNQNGKRMRVVEGGLEFWRGITKSKNSNFKWQGKTDDMSANLQDPSARLRWAIKTFTGSQVISKLDEASNKGRAMMKNFAQTLREQAETTIPNEFNSAFWNTAPGSNEPESVPSLISTTPLVGTIGGLNRTGNQYLQNGVDNTTYSDIGSEAGLAALKLNQIQRAIGSGGKDMVDIMIMGDTNFAGLMAYLQTQRRYRPDDRLAQMDFDTILLGKTTISFENSVVSDGENVIGANQIFGINSNHMSFEVLRDGNFIWNPEGFERVGQKLIKALYFWVFCNLTTNLPKSHFVMTDVSTT